jgi:hypothetical protein
MRRSKAGNEIEVDFLNFVDTPKCSRWRRLIEDPGRCQETSTKYRELLPLEPQEVTDDSKLVIEGLYFVHGWKLARVFCACCGFVFAALGVAVYLAKTVDTSTGFSVGCFILAVPALFLSVLAVVVASTRRSNR